MQNKPIDKYIYIYDFDLDKVTHKDGARDAKEFLYRYTVLCAAYNDFFLIFIYIHDCCLLLLRYWRRCFRVELQADIILVDLLMSNTCVT